MNTEYLPQNNLARWVLSLGVDHRNTQVRCLGVFKRGPSVSLHLAKHQVGSTPHAQTTSGSQTSLCPTTQDGAFWVKALLFALQERWDLPSSANSTLGTSPTQPVCSSPEGTETPKLAPVKVTHSLLLPEKPQSHFYCR